MIGSDGTLRRVCANYEQVENYYKAVADDELWDLHHRREIDEMKSRQQLIDEGKYYNLDPSELIFLTHAEHAAIHSKHREATAETRKKLSELHKGKKLSDEHRNKISENHADVSGEKNPFYGKKHNEDAKKKMSENSAKYWLGKHHSDETIKKMSEARIGENNPSFGKHWWNDGVINKLSKERPGPNFVQGRIKFNK